MSSEERAIAAYLAALVALGLFALWLIAALSSALLGAGWTSTPLGDLLGAAIGLPSHLGDPRVAWPSGLRERLPGALGFYAVALPLTAARGALAVAAYRLAERTGARQLLGASKGKPPSTRWASARDLSALRVKETQPGRLTLGRLGGSLLAAEARESVIVIAPTQSYKTSGLVIPAILEWQGPVLATSVKNDLLGDTLARRQALGEVMIFDPARVTEMPRSRIDPLLRVRAGGEEAWRGAMKVARWLTAGARAGSAAGLQDADFWFAAAEKLLAPLLFAAATGDNTIADVVRWLDEGPGPSAEEIEGLLDATEVAEAMRAWQATQNREERQLSSVYMTAEIVLAAFADPYVVEETSGADYSPTALLNGDANSLYLCAPRSEQERLRPVFSAVVQELLAVVEETVSVSEEPLDPPLLLALDEAANVAPFPTLDELASTAAGQGVQLLTVFQDMAQINVRYGRRASTIFNNHKAKFIGAGISDPETHSVVSKIIGAGEFEQRSRTAGERGRRSTTEGDHYRDLAAPNVLREGEPGSGMLVYGGLPPAKVQLRRWFQETDLLALSLGAGCETESRGRQG